MHVMHIINIKKTNFEELDPNLTVSVRSSKGYIRALSLLGLTSGMRILQQII